jgi:hypothetical protein
MKAILAIAVLLLLTASMAQAETSYKIYAANPSGAGDPDAITCRPPHIQPGTRLLGPEVCKANAIWAQYRRDGMDVAADGVHDVRSEKDRSVHPPACHPMQMGTNSTTTMVSMTFGMVCDQ